MASKYAMRPRRHALARGHRRRARVRTFVSRAHLRKFSRLPDFEVDLRVVLILHLQVDVIALLIVLLFLLGHGGSGAGRTLRVRVRRRQ